MALSVQSLTGPDIAPLIDALADLRIRVFREWPYLYDGDAAYEADYLHEFAAAPDAVLVAAYDGAEIVGAATASPLNAQKREFRAPFEAQGIDVDTVFYFGESVLLSRYRGQGLGHAFFDHREAQALCSGAALASFCAVVRPSDHPLRPAAYRPLDRFWRKRGYAPVEAMVGTFDWRDIGENEETPHPMQYWMRRLR